MLRTDRYFLAAAIDSALETGNNECLNEVRVYVSHSHSPLTCVRILGPRKSKIDLFCYVCILHRSISKEVWLGRYQNNLFWM